MRANRSENAPFTKQRILPGGAARIAASIIPVADDELESSDVILPPADVTLQEASGEFTGEGLIPD